MSGHELLQDFAEHGSQSAFRQLMELHVALVHSAARRHVGDPHRAEDVTQQVFALLAAKAGQLGHEVVLSGWLYRTAVIRSGSPVQLCPGQPGRRFANVHANGRWWRPIGPGAGENAHHDPCLSRARMLGFSYHDLMCRLKVDGPEDAWKRLQEILVWFDEVQAGGRLPRLTNSQR